MTETADPLKSQIKQAIVRSLRLPIAREEIGDATPLFGDGLGLDSIDVLELVLEIERSFGVVDRRRADREDRCCARSTPSPSSSRRSAARARMTRNRRWFRSADRASEQRVHRRRRGVVPRLRRRAAWPSRRLGRAPRRGSSSRHAVACSTCSIAAGVRATFFVVGWVAERYPRLVEARARRRARDRLARPRGTGASTSSTATTFSRDLRASVGR